jgi:polyisoprenoid-binding protein YceI
MSARRLVLLFGILATTVGTRPLPFCPFARGDDRPAAAREAYRVDAGASKVYVKVGLATRLGHEHGVEGGLKSGKVTPGGEGELVFDMTSFEADTPQARDRVGLGRKRVSANEAQKVTAAMRGGEVLDVAQFPTATYRIRSMTPLDGQDPGAPGGYRVEGRFTLRDKERPLQLKARLERTNKEGVLRMTGSFTIRQTDYGMTPATAAGGLAKSADELTIWGDLVLTPARPR